MRSAARSRSVALAASTVAARRLRRRRRRSRVRTAASRSRRDRHRQVTTIDIYSAEPDGNALARLTEDGISVNPVVLAGRLAARLHLGHEGLHRATSTRTIRNSCSTSGSAHTELDWSPDGTRLVASFPNCADWRLRARHLRVRHRRQRPHEPDQHVRVRSTTRRGRPTARRSRSTRGRRAGSPTSTRSTPDGSGRAEPHRRPDMPGNATEPDWSPDASRIAFQSSGRAVQRDRMDREPRRQRTGSRYRRPSAEPAWSPDGERLRLHAAATSCGSPNRHAGPHGPLGAPGYATGLAGAPARPGASAAAAPGYARPKGATPVLVPLVPAYTCPRLRAGSDQAARAAARVPVVHPHSATVFRSTVGTPDCERACRPRPPASCASRPSPGDPTTPGGRGRRAGSGCNQTDVRYNFAQPGYPDYPGELLLVLPAARHGPVQRRRRPRRLGARWSTSRCMSRSRARRRPGPEGATCAVNTTVDAIVPGVVRERERAVWELGQVRAAVRGLGRRPDDLTDNNPFLRSGRVRPLM